MAVNLRGGTLHSNPGRPILAGSEPDPGRGASPVTWSQVPEGPLESGQRSGQPGLWSVLYPPPTQCAPHSPRGGGFLPGSGVGGEGA